MVLESSASSSDGGAAYPPLSLGRAHGAFLSSHSFSLSSRPPTRYASCSRDAYLLTRYRTCHDYYHVLYGVEPTVLGEVILKRVEHDEFGLPAQYLQAVVKGAGLRGREREELEEAEEWIGMVREGRRGKEHLMTVFWEEILDRPLQEVREELGVVGYEEWKRGG